MIVRRAALADAADIAAVHVRTCQAAYAHVFGAERLAGLDVRRRTAGWERSLREPDGGRKEESVLGMRVVEVRLRLRLAPARRRGPRRRG
ncbi:MAG: hypothetical protein KGI93_00310 [Acidobacteriota bacterium]|nr:hypothetical protein [Acidobacteriota bacterium]